MITSKDTCIRVIDSRADIVNQVDKYVILKIITVCLMYFKCT